MAYKEAKEAFVANAVGGTVFRINCVCITALTTYALWTSLETSLRTKSPNGNVKIALIEFIILVIPLLSALTILSDYPIILNSSILSLAVIIRLLYPPLPPSFPPASGNELPYVNPPPRLFSKPFVTIYRAHMMLMTVICILAVDFKVFPREFAKTETWGTSIMDIGVGSFVFALGIVSALPLLRSKDRRSFIPAIYGSVKRSASVLALGVIRLIMVKGVDYPEHLSEYGVHWNFFFTIGLLPVFGVFAERFSPKFDYSIMALIVTVVHQLTLDQTQLQYWTLTAERIDLLSSNKEGLVSLPGYISIYLFGIATGLYILPPDPYFFAKLHFVPVSKLPNEKIKELNSEDEGDDKEKKLKMFKEKPGKLASVLMGYTILWWSLFGVLNWGGWYVSRRMANLPYVIWIVAFNTSLLLAYLLIHTWTSNYVKNSTSPLIFESMNKNGMLVFLVANLLTGLINVTIESMYASDFLAMVVMINYCAVVIGVAFFFRKRSIRI